MRLIDADKCLEDLGTVNPIYRDKVNWAKNIIEAMPTVESRPKGKWLYHRASNGLVVVKCSECKKTYGFLKTNYCPYCGADMRGNENEITKNK